MGRNMATVVTAEASKAGHTCPVPVIAACLEGMPSSRMRMMFSSTMIAASMTMPTANAMPARETTLMVRPVTFINHQCHEQAKGNGQGDDQRWPKPSQEPPQDGNGQQHPQAQAVT